MGNSIQHIDVIPPPVLAAGRTQPEIQFIRLAGLVRQVAHHSIEVVDVVIIRDIEKSRAAIASARCQPPFI